MLDIVRDHYRFHCREQEYPYFYGILKCYIFLESEKNLKTVQNFHFQEVQVVHKQNDCAYKNFTLKQERTQTFGWVGAQNKKIVLGRNPHRWKNFLNLKLNFQVKI